MKNVTKLISFVGTAALALACGSSDKNTDNGSGSTPAPTGLQLPQPETCDTNPFLAGCPAVPNTTPAVTPDPNASAGGGAAAGGSKAGGSTTNKPATDQKDLAKASAENILLSNCGQCHGPNGNNSGNMNYINDIDALVKNGKISPLHSGDSLIIQKMRSGEMPLPPLPPVTTADIDTVAQFIDNPQFWAGETAPGNCADSGQSFDTDKLYKVILNDLTNADQADDALNYRYISITNRFNAGVCNDTSMDLDRQAMTKLVNMLSVDAKTRPPVAVDGGDNMVYRIDLRDYQFDRNVLVNGQNFTDAWEAIINFNQYAVPYVGDQADQAKTLSGTDVPVMFADSMLDSASFGNLYYGIIGIDINQNVDDFILNVLGVDQNQDLLDRNEIRAGTTKSRISRQDRVVERHDQNGGRAGVLWQSFDFEANDANNSIFADPFNFNEGGREMIFTQPNGLMAFAIVDANGVFKEDSDILLDTQQNNFRAITSVSCSSCHSTGFIPVVDEVGPTTLANQRALNLNRDEVEELQEIYITPTAFAAQIASDNQQFYTNALNRLQLPTAGGDPVSGLFLRFDRDVTVYDAAGDLGVTPAELKRDLARLNPELEVLDGSTLDRDDFTQFYVDTLCIESTVLNNVPDANVCQAAADAVAGLNQ